MGPSANCTEARVREIADEVFTAKLVEFERAVVMPLHSSNQSLLAKIEGGVFTLKIMATAIALMIPTAALVVTVFFHYNP